MNCKKYFLILATFLALVFSSCASIETPTQPAFEPISSTDCDKQEVLTYVARLQETMDRVNFLLAQVPLSPSSSELDPILDELDQMYINSLDWSVPGCAQDLHLDLLTALAAGYVSVFAIKHGEIETYEQEYEVLIISIQQMNLKIAALVNSLEDQ